MPWRVTTGAFLAYKIKFYLKNGQELLFRQFHETESGSLLWKTVLLTHKHKLLSELPQTHMDANGI